MPPRQVLIFDDDVDTAGLFETLLTHELGARCTVAGSGVGAGDLVRGLRPALVLLDMRLPGVDGFEVCRQLKADPTTRDVPIVAVSGLVGQAQRERALALGCADWIEKPFDLDDLLTRLRPYLGDPIGGAPG
jgi:CheY-like chemotaxis protein